MVRFLKILLLQFLLQTAHGQVVEFTSPERLPVSVNTDDDESMPLLTPDGQTLYFVRTAHPGNVGGRFAGQDIWVSKLTQNEWGRADNKVFPFNTKGNNAISGISADGKVVYFFSAKSSKKVRGIYFTRESKGNWSPPELIPIDGIESYGSIGFYVSANFDVIFLSMMGKDSRGEEDLYVSIKEAGKWSKPKNLGPTINTAGFEISPFLSADKKRLYFTSNGHPGMGDADIFYSDRLYNSWEAWSLPKNLGPSINSNKFDGFFSIYNDSLCFFSSNRGASGDIYTSRVRESELFAKQSIEVSKLIEESKSLIQEIKSSASNSVFIVEVLSYQTGFLLSETSKLAIRRVASAELRREIVLLGPTKAELRGNTAILARSAKSEMVKAGIMESQIKIPSLESAIYFESELQGKLGALTKDEILLVVMP